MVQFQHFFMTYLSKIDREVEFLAWNDEEGTFYQFEGEQKSGDKCTCHMKCAPNAANFRVNASTFRALNIWTCKPVSIEETKKLRSPQRVGHVVQPVKCSCGLMLDTLLPHIADATRRQQTLNNGCKFDCQSDVIRAATVISSKVNCRFVNGNFVGRFNFVAQLLGECPISVSLIKIQHDFAAFSHIQLKVTESVRHNMAEFAKFINCNALDMFRDEMQQTLLKVVFDYTEKVAVAIGKITEAHSTLQQLQSAVRGLPVNINDCNREDVCYAFSKQFPLKFTPQ